jgi:hypothetical protein
MMDAVPTIVGKQKTPDLAKCRVEAEWMRLPYAAFRMAAVSVMSAALKFSRVAVCTEMKITRNSSSVQCM